MKATVYRLYTLFFLSCLLTSATLLSQSFSTTVLFQVDLSEVITGAKKISSVGLRGSLPPVSWEETYPLTDDDGDGIYTGRVVFENAEPDAVLEYKFIHSGDTWELDGADNRFLVLSGADQQLLVQRWNEATPLTKAQIERFSRIDAADFLKDIDILEESLKKIHPGLYRYNDEASIDRLFTELRESSRRQKTVLLPDAYLSISRLLAAIRCGHTYANFYNQAGLVQQILFHRSDKLPFAFRIVNKRIIITKNASEDDRFGRGTELLAINGLPVSRILDDLIQLVKADGSNDGKRLNSLQVNGYGAFESFDIYFPLLMGPGIKQYDVQARQIGSKETFTAKVGAVSREARAKTLEDRYGPLPKRYEDTWAFRILDEKKAYLKLGTFVTWKMEMDWKAFLKDAFRKLDRQNIENLIIDIRGNEGGADEVYEVLGSYLLKEKVTLAGEKSLVRYTKVPETLQPYLQTWDNAYFDLSGQVEPAGGGFYKQKGDRFEGQIVRPGKKAYRGNTYLLIDASNSSATHIMARIIKEQGLATLVGQETGGSLRGINGGMMFFLRLPHSRIEVDIPVFGMYPLKDQPDKGLSPDILVESRPQDIASGIDSEMEVVRNLIDQHKTP